MLYVIETTTEKLCKETIVTVISICERRRQPINDVADDDDDDGYDGDGDDGDDVDGGAVSACQYARPQRWRTRTHRSHSRPGAVLASVACSSSSSLSAYPCALLVGVCSRSRTLVCRRLRNQRLPLSAIRVVRVAVC